jgi:hypothetical protein
MRIFLILQFLVLSVFALSAFADTFYIITDDQPVELSITYTNQQVKSYTLVNGEKLELALYEKVCSKSDDSEYEVGIENRAAISLKKSYPCYYYVPSSNKKKSSLSEKFAITFRWVKKKLRLESNVRKQVMAEGRGGDIDISKSQYPVMELRFDRNDEIKVIKLIVVHNNKIVNETTVNGNSISLKNLKIGQIYLIQMIGKDGTISVSQRFNIIK